MSEASTRQDIDEVISILRDFMGQVDDRFTSMEKNISELKEPHNHLLITIDSFISRIDKYETELAVRDSQFERLLAWARKVSEKTGIPLENF